MSNALQGGISDVKFEPAAKYDSLIIPDVVSIAGVDHTVDLKDLVLLATEFQNLEWSVLYYPEKQGYPRNPTNLWIEQFHSACLPRTSIHLCGEEVFRRLLNPIDSSILNEEFDRFNRVQLNINARGRVFTTEEVHRVYDSVLFGYHQVEMILQLHDDSREDIKKWLDSRKEVIGLRNRAVSILHDASRGKGIVPTSWNFPMIEGHHLNVAYAGGINPENCEEIARQITQLNPWNSTLRWGMDLESGVRTDNKLDLEKVFSILKKLGKRNYAV